MRPIVNGEDPADVGKSPDMLKSRPKCQIEADRSGDVQTDGELEDVPHVSEHRWQQSGIENDLRC